MPTSLRTQLQHLASTFADSVLAAIRSASIEEVLAESRTPDNRRAPPQSLRSAAPEVAKARARPSGRLARRSPEEIEQTVDRVVALLKDHREGLRAEQIRAQLGMLPKEMPRVLKEGLSAKKIKSKGQKRATTYTAT
jgi:hypothetical protein